MANTVQAFNLRDFSGGLNLDPDEFQLSPNESPELLNVDINYRGGVQHRKGYTGLFATLDETPLVDLHAWYGHGASPCMVTVDAAGRIYEVRDGGATPWSSLHPTSTGKWLERRSPAEFDGLLFLAANNQVLELDAGSGLLAHSAPMVPSQFNQDLDNPKNNRFPCASVVAAWQGAVWAADVMEDFDGRGVKRHPNRLRWSHLNHPKDWHVNHYVDLGDDDGGDITALVADGDRLLVFRERAIHAVVGSPPEAISVYLLSDALGCSAQWKTTRSPNGVFFWSEDRGVYRVTPKEMEWVMAPLHAGMVNGRIDGTDAVLAWGGDRLYVKVDYLTADLQPTYKSWFIFDPGLGKHGGWTRHAFTVTPEQLDEAGRPSAEVDMPAAVWFAPPEGRPMFCTLNEDRVLRRSRTSYVDDTFESDVAPTNRAVFRTAWTDMGQPGQLKRFRRADVVGSGLSKDQQLTLEVFADYDHTRRRRYGEVRLHNEQGGSIFGEGVFGDATFGAPDLPIPKVDRTSPLGRGRSVQFKIMDAVDPDPLPWTIDLIVVKFTPYRMRG